MEKPDADLAVGMERYTGCIDRIDCPDSPYSCKTPRLWKPQKVCISQASNGFKNKSAWPPIRKEPNARWRRILYFGMASNQGDFSPFC